MGRCSAPAWQRTAARRETRHARSVHQAPGSTAPGQPEQRPSARCRTRRPGGAPGGVPGAPCPLDRNWATGKARTVQRPRRTVHRPPPASTPCEPKGWFNHRPAATAGTSSDGTGREPLNASRVRERPGGKPPEPAGSTPTICECRGSSHHSPASAARRQKKPRRTETKSAIAYAKTRRTRRDQ